MRSPRQHRKTTLRNRRIELERLEDRTVPALIAAYGFNDASGTILHDLSANGNHGTISGASWSAAGRFGSALAFDGINDWVTVADAASLDLTTGMTLEAWVKPTAINGWETVLLKEAGTDLAYALYADNNGNDADEPHAPGAWIRQGTTTSYAVGSSQVPLNTWTHLAATYDGATLRTYVNGVEAGSVERFGVLNTTSKPLRIGGNSVWSEWFKGLIDEVRVYNRALTPDEIQADMNSPVTPDTTPPVVTETFPAQGATGVSTSSDITVTFGDSMDASTIDPTTIALRDAGGATVPATIAYDAATSTATITPSVVLNIASGYSVLVRGGTSGPAVADRAGNRLAADFILSFTTAPVAQPAPENVFAAFDGAVTGATTPAVVPIRIGPDAFTITHEADSPQGAHAVFGFVVTPQAGSGFLPRGVTIENTTPGPDGCIDPTRGVHILKTRTQLPDGSSLVLVELGFGDYNVKIGGRNGTTGTWTLTTLLVGDVNGDFQVTASDLLQLTTYRQGLNTNPAVLAAGDADRSGRIGDYDLTLAGWNVGNATTVRVLGATIGLGAGADTGVPGDNLVNTPTALLAGVSRPGALLALDTDGDGFDDGTATAGADGTFALPAALVEGSNTLRVKARDPFGQQSITPLVLTLDTHLTSPIFDLSAGSDTGAGGDQTTSSGSVTLVGQTDPGQTVSLLKNGAVVATALASNTGTFLFPGVSLALGANAFTAHTEDSAGNVRDFALTLTRVEPPVGTQDVVLRWNQATLDAIRLDASAPPVATRALAMVSTAIYDAVSAIEGTPGYLVRLTPPTGASAEAAAATAAHAILSYLYPGQQSAFDVVLAASLAQVPAGPSRESGETFGLAVGGAVIALRDGDGARTFIDYVPANDNPGTWQPTTPMFAEALLPQWATVTPFALTAPDQFRPAAPPALGSAEYAAALNEVKEKGRATGSTRSADETQSALFWADGAGTVTPPGHWNLIASQLAAEQGYGLSANARLFATLNVALADAAIASWDAKYAYGFWRPVTAIGEADSDGNSATAPDTAWTPLLVTPNFPSYTSGHSTFSGAAQIVLESFFGASTSFTATTEAPGVAPRTFTSFQYAAEEAGRSRILGGIHYSFDNQAGLTSGRSIGHYVLDAFSVAADTRAPAVSILTPDANLVAAANIAVSGQVLDNLSGVNLLEVKIDDGAFVPVPFDASGAFAVPTAFALDGTADGLHTLRFRATDYAGNVTTAQTYSFTLDTQAPTIALTAPQSADSLTAGARLSGVASGTGSAVTELTYTFDGSTLLTVVFNPATGAFNQELDLSALSAGGHTLAVFARDAAGHVSMTMIAITLSSAIPLTVTEVSPAAGATDVGSTQRPKVSFSRAINKTTLSGDNFYAMDTTGAHLPAHIVPTDDGMAAWLFLTNPMPGASTITVTVDGSSILAADGTSLDAAGNGVPGSTLTFSFTTVSLASLPGTSLSGVVADPGPDLRPNSVDDVRRGPDGALMTADDIYLNPIANVRVYILGQEDQAVYTDAQGRFTLPSVPSGNVKFVLDGLTATNAPTGCYFPEMTMDLIIEPGKVNTVMGSMGTREQATAGEEIRGVFLPRLKSSILQPVSNTVPTTVVVPADAAPDLTAEQRELLTAEVKPGTAIGVNGQVLTNVQVGISTVPPELIREMLPPGVSEPPFTITVQAPGVVNFTTPIELSYPNVDNAAPGTKMLFISFDHATGRMVIDGTATVTADGKSIVTDPDSGITHPGWHFVQVGTPTAGQPAKPGEVTVLAKGGRGDVIEVDLAGTGGKDFSQVSLSGGQVVYLEPSDVAKGHFYFVPNVNGSESHVQGTFTGTLTRTNEQGIEETKTETGIVRINIKAGYSAFTLTGSVGSGGTNNKLDVYRVQQRLSFLHYPGENNVAVPVNGQNGTVLQQAIKLFQAATQDGGTGNPANEDGRVDVGGQARAWLNASNAPQWKEVPQTYRSTAIGNEIWANSWTLDIIAAAGLGATVTSLTEYPDVGPTVHGEHKAGNDIDWDFNEALVPNNPEYPPNTTLAQMLAGLTPSEQDLVDRVQDAHTAAGSQFVEVLVGGTGTQASYPRVRQVLTALGISNRNVAGHHNHIHVSIQPPTQGAPATLADPDPSFVGQPGRIYYRIALSNGFDVGGQIENSSQFSVVLTPNLSYTATFYQPTSNSWGIYSGQTNASGQITDLGTIILDQVGGPDSDGDGLPDIGELVIGTSQTIVDTDNDGVNDGSEIQQGLDPLDGRSFPTGVIATLPLQGNPERVAVDGDRVYAATGNFGLAVIDGARFDGPLVLGQLDLVGTATDVAVDGSLRIAAVATGSGLALVDVADGTQPKLFRTVDVAASRVIVANGLAYAASGNQLRVIDVASGNLVQSLTLPGSGTLTGFAREGSFLYAFLSGSDTFSVIDIADEGAAVVRGQLFVDVASFDVGLFVGNGIAWLSGSGLRTIDVSNPSNPQIIQTPSGSQFFTARRMALNGSGLGLLLPDGGNFLQVYDTSNPNNVTNLLLQLNLTGNARDVAVSRGVAYVATSNGLEVVNYLPFDNAGTAPTLTASTTAVDQDPVAPGLQVIEGTTIPVRVAVADDVQVRTVELLVNGQVVRNDVSFPFDFFVAAPDIATSGSSFTVQVRAIDTGGNVALSNALTIELVADTFAPTITGFVPPANTSVVEPIQVVQVRFNEPMAAATITSASVRVLDSNGTVLTPTSFQLRDDDRLVQLTFPALLTGSYEILVSGSVTDRAGNALGADAVSPFTLTPRATLSTTVPDADPTSSGVQVFEGTTVPFTVSVAPGVSVQQVELLVNGVPVASNSTAPYQFGFAAPLLAPGVSGFSVVAKVTDTAGLATFTSPPLDFGLLEDVTAPTIASFEPASGGTAFEGLQIVKLNFSEPVAVSSASLANFQLFGAGTDGVLGTDDDVELPITGVQFANDDTQIQLATALLPIDHYRLRVLQDGITDRAGNPLGTGTVESDFELLEQVLINGGFEEDFTGWTVQSSFGGLANVVTGFSLDRNYPPKDGTQFAILRTGLQGIYTTISQQITAQAGDVISGWAFFDTTDYLPFNDNGYVRILSDATVIATPFSSSVGSVGDFGSTDWTFWQYTFTTGGSFTIQAGVTNIGDSGVDSYLGLDAVQLLRGQPQFFAGSPTLPAADVADLTDDQLQAAIEQAVSDLATAGYDVSAFAKVTFHTTDLPGSLLGWTHQNTIWIDQDAAGYGWYTDVSPASNSIFAPVAKANELRAMSNGPASRHVDLLTVVTHELGHVLGFGSIDPIVVDHDWMTATLGLGIRRAPHANAQDAIMDTAPGLVAVAPVAIATAPVARDAANAPAPSFEPLAPAYLFDATIAAPKFARATLARLEPTADRSVYQVVAGRGSQTALARIEPADLGIVPPDDSAVLRSHDETTEPRIDVGPGYVRIAAWRFI